MKTPRKRKLIPASDYIILQPVDTESGALVLQKGSTVREEATIIAVGPDVDKRYAAGMTVIYNAWACDEKEIDGKHYFFAPSGANAIVAIIN